MNKVGHKEIQQQFPSIAKNLVNNKEITAVTNRGKIEGYFIPVVSQATIDLITEEINNPTVSEIENMNIDEINSWIDKVSQPELIKDFKEDVKDLEEDLGWPYEN